MRMAPRRPQLHASEPDILYEVGQRANDLVAAQLAGVTPVTYAAVLAAGLATSLSPCTLSVLPLTIGYIGGYSAPASNAEPSATTQQAKPNITTQALSFSFGLATTLAGLGLLSSSVGLAYGQIGEGLPLLVSLLAIAMGLNLLQAYLAGLAFALAASPCATPVLATLLAWVANTGDPVQGAALLLAYTSGYVAPLLLAATVTPLAADWLTLQLLLAAWLQGSMKQLLSLRQYSAWVTPASGSLLVAGGTFSLLTRLF
ncbi:DsbD domain-containing protein [Haematococcus lacustris]|uniref:DsbD domain-containing protein n=1 Tax=Haematococcus lacustris TaxID=44745 RepID=A0A699ZGR6_HAELA|nr:DsbD domain-containing protein [Haematococcus lacustris]